MVCADPSSFDTVRFQAALLDSVGEAVIATDVGGIVLYWNRAAARLYGWTAQEAVGRSVFELTPAPEYAKEATAIFAELTAGRGWSGEFVVRHRDGHAFPVHVTHTPVFGADGSLQAVIGISTDITERRRSDLAARHLSAIVESSNDAIISEALDGTILSWNSGAERLFGYAATEVIGQQVRILAHDHATEEEISDLYRRVALGQRVQGLETVRRHKDGSLIDVSLTLSPVYDDDGSMSGFAAILRDDSARREVERALKHHSDLLVSRLAKEAEASERLRELDRIKDDLVATVSHELRTPLASILGYLELLKDEEAVPLTSQQGKCVDAMDRNSNRLLALVDNLLTVSTIDAGTLPSSSSPVDLRDVISSARRALQPTIDARRLITHFHLPALPIMVRGDAGQLEQVVCNLLGNAVRFTEDGGTVECAVDIEDSKAKLTVSDDGIGIPENEQPGLFTRFFRSTTATERAIAGTGLGLNIAYSIVRSHGGDISVVSAPGRGTRVTVNLPTLAQSD
jgi:PAS domain S-box-containing protein